MKDIFNKILRRLTVCSLLVQVLCLAAPMRAQAATWIAPEGEVNAGAAIVMDVDTETVLWGSNIYDQCYPASITKIMTGLLILENCDLDEMVTITADSVYGLESGAVTAGLSVGDEVSVRDLLYATLFRSAADSSNALAIHMSGSIEAFAEAMTERARELGCRSTVFKNPSGLTDSSHVTTAYDMALIGRSCMNDPAFMEIESSESYKMGPTEKYPGGLTVTVGHKMVKSDTKYTDERVTGGKTGFITASGNTLITFAESDGRRLVAVVLKDKNPEHYEDTKLLLDFGFSQFENVEIPEPAERFACEERLRTDKIIEGKDCHILSAGPAVVTLPAGADPDEITASYDYNLTADAPELAVARLNLNYADVRVGSVYILNDRESELELSAFEGDNGPGTEKDGKGLGISAGTVLKACGAAAVLLLAVGIVFARRSAVRREEERRIRFRERQRQRLEDMHMSEESFQEIMEERKTRRRGRKPGVHGERTAEEPAMTTEALEAEEPDSGSGPAAEDDSFGGSGQEAEKDGGSSDGE